MHKLDIQEWAEETRLILEQALQALLESQQPEVRALAEQLPEPGGTDDKPVSLAVAGAYSSGKSSMLKALTGRDDIATGAGITTEQTRVFDWNGVEVVDTPGIHTQLRPDHDLRSYEAISRADLLVFVITNELFDSHIGAHFRKLAIDRGKGHEMILVINKMGRAGNTSQTREVITEDLRRPLAPFSPEELRITFTDALSALEVEQESDPKIAEMLRREANIGELVRNLNDLVVEKGLYARQSTVLYAIDQVMQDAIGAEPTGDPDVDALIMIYNQNIRAMEESRSRLATSGEQCDRRGRAAGAEGRGQTALTTSISRCPRKNGRRSPRKPTGKWSAYGKGSMNRSSGHAPKWCRSWVTGLRNSTAATGSRACCITWANEQPDMMWTRSSALRGTPQDNCLNSAGGRRSTSRPSSPGPPGWRGSPAARATTRCSGSGE